MSEVQKEIVKPNNIKKINNTIELTSLLEKHFLVHKSLFDTLASIVMLFVQITAIYILP